MQKHQTILGGIFLAFGLFHVIAILVLLAVFGFGSAVLFTVGAEDPSIPEPVKFIPAGFGLLISTIVAITGIPNLIASYGLLKKRHWGMIAALIVGVLNLLHFPFGTALGIYAIWVYANFRDEANRTEANRTVVI